MKLDLHVHTKYSRDCFYSPYRLLKAANKKGLDGIAITDHNTTKGWKDATKAAKKLNMQLILGEEIKCKEGVEILGLFLKKEIKPGHVEKVIKEIRKQKGIAILAHPFSKNHSFEEIKEIAKKVDAIEILNSRRTKKMNKKALLLCKKFKNKAITASSDAHSPFEIGTAYTESNSKNLKEFKTSILKKRTSIKGKINNWTVHIYSTLPALIAFLLKKTSG